MALEKKYYSGSQVFDIIKELPYKEFLSLLDTFAKERGSDAVEVVRCKECKWYDKINDNSGYCFAAKHGYLSKHWEINIHRTYEPDFYCADGERRDDAEIH